MTTPETPVPATPDDLEDDLSVENPALDVVDALYDKLDQGNGPITPLNQIVSQATVTYLEVIQDDPPTSGGVIEKRLLGLVNGLIQHQNLKARTATEKLPLLRSLTNWQVAQILLHLHHIIRIAPNAKDTDREYDLLAMYQGRGPGRGTYTTSEDEIRTTARQYNTALTLKDFIEVLAVLREDSPRTHQCGHRDLIAVDNGVFHYGREDITVTLRGKPFHFQPKTLHPFDPAMVFLSKCHVSYVPDPENPKITNPETGHSWDVLTWIEELSEDAGMSELIWEILGAIIRPHVSWGKTAWFYSESGNNGKGTLCALMRNLCGPRAHTSIPLADFGKDFALEPLVRASAIIVDENDVGTFIDKAANLKAIVTNDVIQINRKYRMPIAYQFFGFMVQCLNEFPRVKDKSESFYRRQLFLPFRKSFTGAERPEIKNDYLHREEVLQYVLWYVLHKAGAEDPGCYYRLSEPVATKEVLAEYKEANDPVRGFWAEFREQLVWDLLPFPFLYDLYKAWFCLVSPSGSPVSRQQFVNDLTGIIAADTEWHCPDKARTYRPGSMMDDPEPLIREYNLTGWVDQHYAGGVIKDNHCRPDPLRPNYRGLLRTAVAAATA